MNELLIKKTTERRSIRYGYLLWGVRKFHNLIEDVYNFEESNKDMKPTRYGDILEDNGLEWGTEFMKNADVSNLNAQCVLALIMGAVRASAFGWIVIRFL